MEQGPWLEIKTCLKGDFSAVLYVIDILLNFFTFSSRKFPAQNLVLSLFELTFFIFFRPHFNLLQENTYLTGAVLSAFFYSSWPQI